MQCLRDVARTVVSASGESNQEARLHHRIQERSGCSVAPRNRATTGQGAADRSAEWVAANRRAAQLTRADEVIEWAMQLDIDSRLIECHPWRSPSGT